MANSFKKSSGNPEYRDDTNGLKYQNKQTRTQSVSSVTRLGDLAPIGRQFNLTGAVFSYFYHKKRPKMSKFLDFS